MNKTLKLFVRAAREMLRTRKIRILLPTVICGCSTEGFSVAFGNPHDIAAAVSGGLAAGITQALLETGYIYNRLRREQKLSSPSNG